MSSAARHLTFILSFYRDSSAAKRTLPVPADDHELSLRVEEAADPVVAGLVGPGQGGPPGPGVTAQGQQLGRELLEASDDKEPDPGDSH